MEGQFGALGLVLNAIVLWTTLYLDAALARLQAEGHELREEDTCGACGCKAEEGVNAPGHPSGVG